MKTYVTKLMQLEHLTRAEAYGLCEELFATTNAAQIAAALVLLHAKGEIADELLGFIDFIQAQMIPIHYPGDVLDIVGTGGDGADTVNISTAAALLAARCGARVIKHGSRSRSSRCGSASIGNCRSSPTGWCRTCRWSRAAILMRRPGSSSTTRRRC